MKKFGLKIFSLVIALVVAVVLTGCVIQQGTKIEFTQLPAGVYSYENGSINLDDVKISINDAAPITLTQAKKDFNVTITGDSWTVEGEYTLVVILDGAAVSFKYTVKKEIAQVNYDTTWDGLGTEDSPWLIQNEEQLRGLAAVVNGKAQNVNGVAVADKTLKGKYLQLTNDIELAPGWEPIGAGNRKQFLNANYFAGNFDGDNHVISGLTNVGYNPVEVAGNYKNSSDELVNNGYVFGLFGVVFGATIENVKMAKVFTEDISIVIDKKVVNFQLDSVGAVAGYIPHPLKDNAYVEEEKETVTTFINCHVLSGEINGYDAAAGVIGRSYHSLYAENCSNAANVACERGKGGKCGGITAICSFEEYAKHVIKNCSNSGNIIVENANLVGGIVGYVASTGFTFEESGNTNTGRLFALNENGEMKEYFVLGSLHSKGQPHKNYKIENIENWK